MSVLEVKRLPMLSSQVYNDSGYAQCVFLSVYPFVCEFHIIIHLLCWASGGGGATNSISHVFYLAISHSCYRALQDVKLLPNQSINQSDCDSFY